MKYNIYRKKRTEPQGRRRLCEEQTGWCDCATVINQSRHRGAENLWSSDDEWHCAGRGPGQWVGKEWHSAIHRSADSRDRGCVASLYDPASSIAKKEKRVFHGLVLNCHQNMTFFPWNTSEKSWCLPWPHSSCLLLQTESMGVSHVCSSITTFVLQWWSAEDLHTKAMP